MTGKYKIKIGSEETKRGSYLLQFINFRVKQLNRGTKTNQANAIKYNSFYYLSNINKPTQKTRVSGIYFIDNKNFFFDIIEENKTYYKAELLKENNELFINITEIGKEENFKLKKIRKSFDFKFSLESLLQK